MDKQSIKKRLSKILDINPQFKRIIMSPDSIEKKRKRLRYLLSDIRYSTFDDNPKIPSLEWILVRNAVSVFISILSRRSERLAGYSIIQYLNDLIHRDDYRGLQKPLQGFFYEFEHLLKCLSGKTEIYSEKVPAYLKYQGRKAAKLRSADLSRMARGTKKFIDRYTTGLDKKIVQLQSKNKTKILKYFGATEFEWENWKWHAKNVIRDATVIKSIIKITDEEEEAISLARKHKIPFGITPYYLSLMDVEPGGSRDRAVRAQVIPDLNYVNKIMDGRKSGGSSMDFMLEGDTSPIDGITRRYPNILIIKPIMTCPQICVYCQRNWEIEDVYSQGATLTDKKLERAIKWVEETPEINEVLITGGDPLLLSDNKIDKLLYRLSRIKQIERIRIGTRVPITLPMRVTDSLVRKINRFHEPGRREIIIITHFEHLSEITPQSLAAVQKFRRNGMQVYNQLVYTFFNSRKFEAVALRHKLQLIGVTPYYTFNTKGKEETDEYRVPIARLLQEQQEEARLMPGTVRTDEIVFNVPRLGKNYLRASQHHDVISILPDGKRVFEFHPWEKKLSLMDTYIYTDVSIYDYLKKLKGIGEETRDYNTIWYYY
jgi:lysine 2,3-aminomutase